MTVGWRPNGHPVHLIFNIVFWHIASAIVRVVVLVLDGEKCSVSRRPWAASLFGAPLFNDPLEWMLEIWVEGVINGT